jgi:small-conductance mechanosensitive channel
MFFRYIAENWHMLALYVGLLAGSLLAAVLARSLLDRLLLSLVRRGTSLLDKSQVNRATRPLIILFFFFFDSLISVTPALPEGFPVLAIRRILISALILALGWQVASLISLGGQIIINRHATSAPDNLTARKVNTQIVVLRRLLHSLVAVVTLAFVLMVFPAIRNLGAGLFASAGIVGLIAGIAARPALGNLIAGLQIAFAQPIRIDDVVIVEGEWGWIEEIRTTYVVIRIWDLRRLVVPISYFIEKPFQNWTRVTADLLGTVFLYTDYTVPVQAVREELHRVLKSTDLWDGKVWNLQVTDTTDRTMELRALMSAPDSSRAWDLRCLVREKMIDFLQREYPDSLPKIRAEMEPKARPEKPSRRPGYE